MGAVALPEGTGLAQARAGQDTMVVAELGGTPVRVFSTPLVRPEGVFVIQVVGDRLAELRTLTTLVTVLLVGGLAVLLASLALGWVYADRALVPIREAMRRQREFAADASHELRTPLAVVRGSVEDLRRNASSPVSEVGDALDDIETEVDRMRALVDDLLLLARTDSGVVELAVNRPTWPRSPSTPPMACSRPPNGRPSVSKSTPIPCRRPGILPGSGSSSRSSSTTRSTLPRRPRRSGSSVDGAGGSGRIRVDDDGPGFRTEDLPHVFDRFWRAPDAPTGGTGLGLSIAAWIAERHGGTVVAENRPEGGARLEVLLPIR